MSQFSWCGQLQSGGSMSGVVDASSGEDATTILSNMGLRNIEVCLVESSETDRDTSRTTLSRDDFLFFNEQLAGLASSGICLDKGLRQMAADIESPRLRKLVGEIAGDIEAGKSLDEAVEQRARGLPVLYGRVLRAGSATGRLPMMLLNLSQHMRLISSARRAMAEAVTYPVIVFFIAIAVMMAVVQIIVPTFVTLYLDIGVRMPATISILYFIQQYSLLILLCIGLLFLLAIALNVLSLVVPRCRMFREWVALRLPLLGGLLRNSLRARFLRGLAFSVESGVSLPEAFRMSADATSSQALQRECEQVALLIEKGNSARDACMGWRIIPAICGFLFESHSSTGMLHHALMHTADSFEEYANQYMNQIRIWVGPVATCMVGVLVGLMVWMLFKPMFNTMWAIQF